MLKSLGNTLLLWSQMLGLLWLLHYPELDCYFFPKLIFFFYLFYERNSPFAAPILSGALPLSGSPISFYSSYNECPNYN